MSVRVRRLETEDEFERYARFPSQVYRRDPCWSPPPPEPLVRLLSGRAPRCQTLRVQPFWVEQDERIVATATAVIDTQYNRRWKETLGHLVSFEALPDCGVAVDRLLGHVVEYFEGQNCVAIRASYLAGWQLPLTIDGYNAPASAFHTYNPAYYHSYLKNSGFETEKGMVEYQLRLTPQLAGSHRELVARAQRDGIRLRCWDAAQISEEIRTYEEVFNAAFAEHWGMMAYPREHFQALAVKRAVVPEFQVIATVDGKPVGAVSSPPNVNQALLAARRDGFDTDSPEYDRAWNKIDHGILLAIGVKKEFRGRGIAAAMAANSYLAMHERGYKLASFSPILDDNWPSRRTAEKVGGRVARNYVIYRRTLRQQSVVEVASC